MYVRVYIRIHKQREIYSYSLMSSFLFCCLCVYDFRADHFVLDNQSGSSSLGEANSPSAIIGCLQFFVQGWDLVRFPSTVLACLLVLSLFGSCLSNQFEERQSYNTSISKTCSVMLRESQRQELCCKCINSGWTPPQSIDVCIVFSCGFL